MPLDSNKYMGKDTNMSLNKVTCSYENSGHHHCVQNVVLRGNSNRVMAN